MKTYPFSALFSRMKYITRWCLMRSTRPESLSEHTADTAMLAHTLCLIGRHCTGTGAALRPEVVATAAIYHDAPEILTGDMPTPVKYKNDALRTAYKAVEHESARVMASLQPEELQAETQVWLTGSVLNDAERKILKAADRLSAVIKCIEEDRGATASLRPPTPSRWPPCTPCTAPRRSISSSTCCPATSRIWTN